MGQQNNYVVENLELATEHLVKFVQEKSGMAYAFVTDHEGVLTVHERWSQPCYGEMRPYGKTHPDLLPEHQREVRKPGDLNTPFPDKGNPIMAILRMYQSASSWNKTALAGLNDFLKLYIDEERSPWRQATKDAEIIRDAKDIPIGILFPRTDFMPTLLIEGWMFLRSRMSEKNFAFWHDLREKYPDVDPAKLLLFWYGVYTWDGELYSHNWGGYYLGMKLELDRFLNGQPIIDGPTLFERGAYNRPKLHDVFGDTGKNMSQVFSEAGITGSFPRVKVFEYVPKFLETLNASA